MGGDNRRFRWPAGGLRTRNDSTCSKKTNAGEKWSKNQIRHDASYVYCHGHVRMHENAGILRFLFSKGCL